MILRGIEQSQSAVIVRDSLTSDSLPSLDKRRSSSVIYLAGMSSPKFEAEEANELAGKSNYVTRLIGGASRSIYFERLYILAREARKIRRERDRKARRSFPLTARDVPSKQKALDSRR